MANIGGLKDEYGFKPLPGELQNMSLSGITVIVKSNQDCFVGGEKVGICTHPNDKVEPDNGKFFIKDSIGGPNTFSQYFGKNSLFDGVQFCNADELPSNIYAGRTGDVLADKR